MNICDNVMHILKRALRMQCESEVANLQLSNTS